MHFIACGFRRLYAVPCTPVYNLGVHSNVAQRQKIHKYQSISCKYKFTHSLNAVFSV